MTLQGLVGFRGVFFRLMQCPPSLVATAYVRSATSPVQVEKSSDAGDVLVDAVDTIHALRIQD